MLDDAASTPEQWAKVCSGVEADKSSHAHLMQQLQMHIAHVDAVLPNGHVQRQTLRDGEAGVTKRLTSWQNLIEEQQAIYGMVRRAAGHMAELQGNQQKNEKPS